MTCIVGLKHKGRVYLGGDSRATRGWDEVHSLALPKVIRWGDFLIGSCGDYRKLQLVQYSLQPSNQRIEQSDLHYIVTGFAEEARKVFKEQGLSEIENNKESASGAFLVGYRGELYFVGADFAVGVERDSFDAIGSGASYALGALSVLEDVDLSPKKKIKLALQAATRFSNGVDGNYTIIAEKTKK